MVERIYGVEPVYGWCVEDDLPLDFYLEQAFAPVTTYVHKSFVAEGLAGHVQRLQAALEEIASGESNGMPNGGIMCRAIAREALVQPEQTRNE